MHRRLLTIGLALTLVALVAPAVADDFRDATDLDTGIEILSLATPGAAAGLGHSSECVDGNPRVRRVHFDWTRSDARALAQRLDISKFRDGFEKGNFETTGRLGVSRHTATLDMGEPGINYYWRVLTEIAGGWLPSAVGRFEVPICPLDMPAELPGR